MITTMFGGRVSAWMFPLRIPPREKIATSAMRLNDRCFILEILTQLDWGLLMHRLGRYSFGYWRGRQIKFGKAETDSRVVQCFGVVVRLIPPRECYPKRTTSAEFALKVNGSTKKDGDFFYNG